MSTTAVPLRIWRKDPNATLDYSIDWKLWLRGDTIVSSTWSVPAGITNASDSKGVSLTTIWLSSGTDGSTYDIVNQIATAAGRTDERTIRVQVVNQ